MVSVFRLSDEIKKEAMGFAACFGIERQEMSAWVVEAVRDGWTFPGADKMDTPEKRQEFLLDYLKFRNGLSITARIRKEIAAEKGAD